MGADDVEAGAADIEVEIGDGREDGIERILPPARRIGCLVHQVDLRNA